MAAEACAAMADHAFCELLKAHRRVAGYSQETLAERAGLSVNAVATLEQGVRRAPHRDTVDALSRALTLTGPALSQFETAAAWARRRQRRDDAQLPVSLTSFIDRAELHDLERLLDERRLVTITGPGGVGKTRIAIELARRAEPRYDETWFVDLVPVRDGNLVRAEIAARLNVQVSGEDGLTDIVHRLHSRHALLVVDNCEHVVTDAAAVIDELLHRCPSLTIVATSREALAVSGEHGYRLPPMDAKSASDLFVDRAREGDVRWQPDAGRIAVVEDICKELDRIPLAIELAASRVSTLGLHALRAHLRGGSGFVRGREVADRHRTMASTIAWSFDLLSGAEKELFRRLSVFMGGFTLSAAQDVCAVETVPADGIADVLSQLARKSLIDVEHLDTAVRYRFLEPIRIFARERLREAGELEDTVRRFASWLKAKAAMLDADPPPQLLLDERVELENIRYAVRLAASSGESAAIASAAEIMIGFRNVWFGSGRLTEFRLFTFDLLRRLEGSDRPDLAGLLVHAVAGFLAGPELLKLSTHAIPSLVAAGYSARAADLHARCASAECMRGDAASAEEHLVAGEALLDPTDYSTRTGFSFASHGAYVRYLLRHFEGARTLLSRAQVRPGESFEVDVQVLLALIASGEGRLDQAIDVLENAKPGLERHANANHLTILVYGNLAGYQLLAGNTQAAEEALREALEAAVDTRDPWLTTGIAGLGRHAAFFAARSGRGELAARLIGVTDRHSNSASLEKDDVASRDLALQAIGEQLPIGRAAALRRLGAAEDLYEVLEEYLVQSSAAVSVAALEKT